MNNLILNLDYRYLMKDHYWLELRILPENDHAQSEAIRMEHSEKGGKFKSFVLIVHLKYKFH